MGCGNRKGQLLIRGRILGESLKTLNQISGRHSYSYHVFDRGQYSEYSCNTHTKGKID